MDENSFSSIASRCQYHIVFASKYRRQIIYGKVKTEIGIILRKLCEYKEVEILKAEACPDHIHMLVSIPTKLSVASFFKVPKRQKLYNDIREIRQPQIQIRKQKIPVQRLAYNR